MTSLSPIYVFFKIYYKSMICIALFRERISAIKAINTVDKFAVWKCQEQAENYPEVDRQQYTHEWCFS